MYSFSVSEAEEDFGALVSAAQHQPVVIRNGNGESVLLLSPEEYKRFRQWRTEEFTKAWEELSAEAQANGLTEEKLAELLADEG